MNSEKRRIRLGCGIVPSKTAQSSPNAPESSVRGIETAGANEYATVRRSSVP